MAWVCFLSILAKVEGHNVQFDSREGDISKNIKAINGIKLKSWIKYGDPDPFKIKIILKNKKNYIELNFNGLTWVN